MFDHVLQLRFKLHLPFNCHFHHENCLHLSYNCCSSIMGTVFQFFLCCFGASGQVLDIVLLSFLFFFALLWWHWISRISKACLFDKKVIGFLVVGLQHFPANTILSASFNFISNGSSIFQICFFFLKIFVRVVCSDQTLLLSRSSLRKISKPKS